MDIDVDWCLTCQRHIEGSHPYCSSACHFRAAPASATCAVQSDSGDDRFVSSDNVQVLGTSSRSSPPSRWPGTDSSGIAAWAADIPPNAPPPTQDDIPLPPPHQQQPLRARTLIKSHRAPPKLLNAPRLIAPPCLSVSTTIPAQSSSSSPIRTSSRPSSADPPAKNTKGGTLSSNSARTDSPVSTPHSSSSICHPSVPIFCQSRKSSFLGDMYIHVRSWVAPAPAIFVPVQILHQQRPPLPVQRVDSLSRYPPHTNKCPTNHHYLGRGRHLPEPAINDERPSFKSRGRKASRVAE